MADRTCTTADCNGAHYAKGLCKSCYRRDWYATHREHELAGMARWRASNYDYDRQRWAEFYAQHAARLSERKRAAYRDDHHAALARAAEYRHLNPQAQQAWRDANPEAWALSNRANGANHRKNSVGRIGTADLRAILEEHGMVCHICSGEIAGLADLHFDHVVPLEHGGPNSRDNIRPAHATCNMRKGRRTA